MDTKICLICSAEATFVTLHPGYRQGTSFRLFECSDCGASFADPLQSDAAVYEQIYAIAEKLPGYSRYYGYAAAMPAQSDPLSFLAESEDVYWSVREFVRTQSPTSKILEVGSGLGYLTYALRRSGYDATGLEQSQQAVTAAEKRFGDYYLCSTVEQLDGEGNLFDIVISTEVIEHIPDPVGFVQQLMRLIKPGGAVLLTTPNKTFWVKGTWWMTEAPPVHLWWLTEGSAHAIARRVNAKCDVLDFTAYNLQHPGIKPRDALRTVMYNSVIDKNGQQVFGYASPGSFTLANRVSAMLRRSSLLRQLLLPSLRILSRALRTDNFKTRGTLAFALRKPQE